MANRVKVGNRWVGEGAPTFVIAEIGSNHDGKLSQAKELIDATAEAGADAAKFQIFSADTLFSRKTPALSYLKALGPDVMPWNVAKATETPGAGSRSWRNTAGSATSSLCPAFLICRR